MEREFFLDRLWLQNNALFLYKKHFCLIWKSEGIIFYQAIEELKDNFKS